MSADKIDRSQGYPDDSLFDVSKRQSLNSLRLIYVLTQLLTLNYLLYSPTDRAPQFLQKLTPFIKQCSLYIMDSRISRHYTHDIHQPSTPDKEKKKTSGGRGGEGRGGEGRIPKGRQIRKFKHAQISILAKCCLMTQYLGNRKKIFRLRLIAFPSVDFLRKLAQS